MNTIIKERLEEFAIAECELKLELLNEDIGDMICWGICAQEDDDTNKLEVFISLEGFLSKKLINDICNVDLEFKDCNLSKKYHENMSQIDILIQDIENYHQDDFLPEGKFYLELIRFVEHLIALITNDVFTQKINVFRKTLIKAKDYYEPEWNFGSGWMQYALINEGEAYWRKSFFILICNDGSIEVSIHYFNEDWTNEFYNEIKSKYQDSEIDEFDARMLTIKLGNINDWSITDFEEKGAFINILTDIKDFKPSIEKKIEILEFSLRALKILSKNERLESIGIEINEVTDNIFVYLSPYAMGEKFKSDYKTDYDSFDFNGVKRICEYFDEGEYEVDLGNIQDYTIDDFKTDGKFTEEIVPILKKQKELREKKAALYETLKELEIIEKDEFGWGWESWRYYGNGYQVCGPVIISPDGEIQIIDKVTKIKNWSVKSFETGGKFVEKYMPQLNLFKENQVNSKILESTLKKAKVISKDVKLNHFTAFGCLYVADSLIIEINGEIRAYLNKYALGKNFTSSWKSENHKDTLLFNGKEIECDFCDGDYGITFGNFSELIPEDCMPKGNFAKELVSILKRDKEFNDKKNQIKQSLAKLKILSEDDFWSEAGAGSVIADHLFIDKEDGSIKILGDKKGRLKNFPLKEFDIEGKFIQENLDELKKIKVWNKKKESFLYSLKELNIVDEDAQWDNECIEFKSISKVTFYDNGKISIGMSSDGLDKVLEENKGVFKFNGKKFDYDRADYNYIICELGNLDKYKLKDFEKDGAFTQGFIHLLELDKEGSESRNNMYDAYDNLISDLDEIYDSKEQDDFSEKSEFAKDEDKSFVEKMEKFAEENDLIIGYKYFYLTSGIIESELVEKAIQKKNYKAFKRIFDYYEDTDNFDLDEDFIEYYYDGLPDTVELYFMDKTSDGTKPSIFGTDKEIPENIENELFEHQVEITPAIFKKITLSDHESG